MGVSRLSVESLLSHSTEELHRRNLLCVQKVSGIENFYARDGVARECLAFPSKIC